METCSTRGKARQGDGIERNRLNLSRLLLPLSSCSPLNLLLQVRRLPQASKVWCYHKHLVSSLTPRSSPAAKGCDKRNLAPVVVGLTGLALPRPDIARLPLFGSSENLLRALKNNPYPERVQAMVACAEGLGVPRGSGMFRSALQAVGFLSKEKITAKMEYLKNTFKWSDAEVAIVVCKAPMVLRISKETLQLRSDFFFSEVGLKPAYIARFPTLIHYSLKGWTRPRHYVVKFIKENGLLDHKWSFNSILLVSKKVFVETFILPHKEAAPHLNEDYAAACRGEVPARLMFA